MDAPFKEEKQMEKSKTGKQQQTSAFTLVFFTSKLALVPFSLSLIPPLAYPPPTFSTLPRSHSHLGDHFSSPSLFKTLFPLSITWRSFRSVAWSNAPQRSTWNRGHAQLIHHFPPTNSSPLPQSHPHCSSFMHTPVSFHSCSVSLLYRSPSTTPFSFPGFLSLIYHRGNLPPPPPPSFLPLLHLQPHNTIGATKHHLTTHTYKLCNCNKRLLSISFQNRHGWHGWMLRFETITRGLLLFYHTQP